MITMGNFGVYDLMMKMFFAQLCPTLCDPMEYNLPGSSVQGILQARILGWVTIPFSRGSSQPRDQTRVSYIAGRFFTAEPLVKIKIAFVYRKIFKSNKLKRKTFVKVGKKNAAGFGPGLG